MNQNPLISVIIPIYNADDYLEETLDSILNQSYKNYEIILINDGSTDGSEKICNSYSKKSSLISYYFQINSGVALARYLGVQKAKGGWVTFVDADDTLTEDALQVLVNELLVSDFKYDIIIANNKSREYSSNELKKCLLTDESICGPWSKLFKKNLFDFFQFDIPRSIKVGEDLLMNLRVLKKNEDILVKEINKKIYNYKRNLNSATSKFIKTIDYESFFYEELLKSFDNNEVNEFIDVLILSRIRGLEQAYLSSKEKINKNSSYIRQLLNDVSINDYKLNIYEYILLNYSNYYKLFFYIKLLIKKIN